MQRSVIATLLVLAASVAARGETGAPSSASGHRSPVDLVLSADGAWLATANQSSGSVSLVRVTDGAVLHEMAVGERPASITLFPSGDRLLVACQYSGELMIVTVAGERLSLERKVPIGFEPLGAAISADGRTAYVALSAADCVAVVDLESGAEAGRVVVGRQPRYLALSANGERLAVGVAGERGVAIVDVVNRQLVHVDRFVGLNIGHVAFSPVDNKAYFPWMVYRRNPISTGNIRLGWVLASRLARIDAQSSSRREAISLDPPGKAVADPHGIAISSDNKVVVVSSSGTHELLVFDNERLPYKDRGSTDHIDPELLKDASRFARIELGGRPLGLRMTSDGQTAFVANSLRDAVQVVDVSKRALLREIPLCEPVEPTLARQGEAIFFDARRSLDQWYSCHSCHYEGGGNAVTMDTNNDGGRFTFKTVLPLFHVNRTEPWTWHGWQTDLTEAVSTSMTSTMLGPAPSEHDMLAVVEYLKSLRPPRSSRLDADGKLSAAAERGRQVFESAAAGCASCHSGPHLTDGKIHDVGLDAPGDRYSGFNTPTLLGVHRKLELLHDGRSKSLDDLLTGPHAPDKVAGERPLEKDELEDLIEYLQSL